MPFNRQEIIALRETFLFHYMSNSAYMNFAAQTQIEFARKRYRAKEIVQIPESPEHCIAIVTAGRFLAHNDDKQPDIIMREGFVIGAVELFSSNEVELPEIVADQESCLLFITASQMRWLFEVYPELMMRYINFLTGQIHALKWENTLATTESGDARLLQFLSANMEKQEDEYVVKLPYSISALAGRLHMSRATLYRVFDRLVDEGVLEKHGKTLIVRKPELLHRNHAIG